MKHYLKEIIFFVITMTLFANALSLYRSQDLSHSPLNVDSFKLINNQEYQVAKNKPVLVHFWASWCPTCKLEASNIEFLSHYFEVITIAVKSGSDEKLQKYLDENNYTFKVINDQNGKLSSIFHIPGFPTTFIYDKNKKMVFSEVGYTSTPGLYLRMLWAGK